MTSDECFEALHRAGWSISDTEVIDPGRRYWLVTGTNGENAIRAEGASQSEAWQAATEQAEAMGLLRCAAAPRDFLTEQR